MAQKPDSSLYLLGKYMGLIFLLPSAALAGYLLGSFAEHYTQWSAAKPFGIIFGVIAGLVKLFQELLRDANRSDSSNKPQ
jgi:F0F1-type ATP synthase assembly protein I